MGRRCSLVLALFAAGTMAGGAAAAEIRIEEAWIPMPDGARLSADLYRAEDEEPGARLPVLLEYLPYRKHEGRARNYSLYSYFVERGYVVAAVDIRGTGESEGRLVPYEYSDIEHEDGEAVIAWLASRPWSNGRVGMFGISWGGFNAIQMALRNPPALKAIIAIDATEDLYQEDVHYIDGSTTEDVPLHSAVRKWDLDRAAGLERRQRLVILAVKLTGNLERHRLAPGRMSKLRIMQTVVAASIEHMHRRTADLMRSRPDVEVLTLDLTDSSPDFFETRCIPEYLRVAKEVFPEQLAELEARLRAGKAS